MRTARFIVAVLAAAVVAAAPASIVDNKGKKVEEPELSDSERQKQIPDSPVMAPVGSVIMNDSKPNERPTMTQDTDGDAAIRFSANDEQNRRIDGKQALGKANSDIVEQQERVWWKLPLLGIIFCGMGFGVLLWVRSWAERNVPPPPGKKRPKR